MLWARRLLYSIPRRRQDTLFSCSHRSNDIQGSVDKRLIFSHRQPFCLSTISFTNAGSPCAPVDYKMKYKQSSQSVPTHQQKVHFHTTKHADFFFGRKRILMKKDAIKKIRQSIDPDFSEEAFLIGAKFAILKVVDFVIKRDFDSLKGMVHEAFIATLKGSYQDMGIISIKERNIRDMQLIPFVMYNRVDDIIILTVSLEFDSDDVICEEERTLTNMHLLICPFQVSLDERTGGNWTMFGFAYDTNIKGWLRML